MCDRNFGVITGWQIATRMPSFPWGVNVEFEVPWSRQPDLRLIADACNHPSIPGEKLFCGHKTK